MSEFFTKPFSIKLYCLVIFLIFSIQARTENINQFSSASLASLEGFCRTPYEAICGDQGQKEKTRLEKIEKIKSEMSLNALKLVARKFRKIPFKGLTLEKLINFKDQKLRQEALRIYYQSMFKQIQKNLGNAPLSALMHFDRIKKYMLQSIVNLTKVNRKESEDMQKRLEKIEFVDIVSLLNGRHSDKNLMNEVFESCDDDGMQDNAFAFPGDEKLYVVLCPGDYLAAIGPTDKYLEPSELALAGEVWTLGHETGHHIDSEDHPITYEKMRTCISRNYLNQLGRPDSGQAQVDNYLKEITADYWGSEVLAAYIESIPEENKKFRALQESLEGLCGTEDDNDHPNGRFRIENLVRRNPRIHKAALCKEPANKNLTSPTCTLRGEWRIRFW